MNLPVPILDDLGGRRRSQPDYCELAIESTVSLYLVESVFIGNRFDLVQLRRDRIKTECRQPRDFVS